MARRCTSKEAWWFLLETALSLRPIFPTPLLVGDAAVAGVLHQPDIFRQGSASRLIGRHLPGPLPLGQFLIRQIDADQISLRINGDAIAGTNQTNGAAILRFRRD